MSALEFGSETDGGLKLDDCGLGVIGAGSGDGIVDSSQVTVQKV